MKSYKWQEKSNFTCKLSLNSLMNDHKHLPWGGDRGWSFYLGFPGNLEREGGGVIFFAGFLAFLNQCKWDDFNKMLQI